MAGGFDLVGQRSGDYIDISLVFEGDVVEVRMEGDGEGRGQSPGSGGPGFGVDAEVRAQAGDLLVLNGSVIEHRIAHVDRGAGMLLVFDFGFGEGGAVVDAPVDRLEAAGDETGPEEAVKSLEGGGPIVARPG